MTDKNAKLETIKLQIDLLKKKLNNMDEILISQEKILNLIAEKSKTLFLEATQETSPEEIMKKIFPHKKLPKILFK